MINFSAYSPVGYLSDAVHSIWQSSQAENQRHSAFKVLNDGRVGLLIVQQGVLELVRSTKKIKLKPGAYLTAPDDKLWQFIFNTKNSPEKIRVKGIRFHYGWHQAFVSMDFNRLKKAKIVKLEDDMVRPATGHGILDLGELFNCSVEQINNLLCFHFLSIRDNAKTGYMASVFPSRVFISVLDSIRGNPEKKLIRIYEENNISARDCQRLFRKYLGLTPKMMQRIFKIHSVKNSIVTHKMENLTDLALDLGYYDQPHFNREFSHFMEEKPFRYLKFKKKNHS